MHDLIETSNLMRTQSNRHTQYPLFIIQEEQEVPKAAGCGNLTKYFNGDTMQEMTYKQYQALDAYLCEDEVDENDIELIKLLEDVGYDALEDVDLSDWREVCYDIEWVYRDESGVFFTEKSCHDHIESNHYHYNKPRSYVISAWRNPEMVATMQMILKLTGDEIPSHYQ